MTPRASIPKRIRVLVVDDSAVVRSVFQQELAKNEVPVPVILITGFGDIPMTVRAMKAGAVSVLPKPFEEEEMLAAVGDAGMPRTYAATPSASVTTSAD